MRRLLVAVGIAVSTLVASCGPSQEQWKGYGQCMSDMNDNTIPFGKTAEEIIWDAVQEYEYPVCFNFPAGHIPDNRELVMGGKVIFKVKALEISLKFC